MDLSWLFKVVEKFWEYAIFWVVVDEWERGVRLTWGKNPYELTPGLHLKFPFADYVIKANVEADTMEIKPVHVTINDGKTITATPVIEYKITNIIKWLIYTNDAPTNLHDITGIVSADYLSDKDWSACIDRRSWTEIKNKLNPKVSDMGVKVTTYGLRGISSSKMIITRV